MNDAEGAFPTNFEMSYSSALQERGANPSSAAEEASARRELADSPISAEAVRRIASYQEVVGNTLSANSMFSLAATLGWRDYLTQLWLAQAFLNQRDLGKAVERLDAALRLNPSSQDLYGSLDQLINDHDFATLLMSRLALSPPWRSAYLGTVSSLTEQSVISKANVIEQLAASNTPPSAEEASPIIAKMIEMGSVRQARELWLKVSHDRAGAIYNPGFLSSKPTGVSVFSWNLPQVLGSNASIGTNGTDSGLLVSSDGSASGILAKQMILLNPGKHTLSIGGSIPSNASLAYSWSVKCTDRQDSLVDSLGRQPPFAFVFVVPSNCNSQYVELSVTPSPLIANESVVFDKLMID